MSTAKKITIQIDADILKNAMKSTQKGITETIRQGLRLVAAKNAYSKAKELRGKHAFKIDVKKLREDR